MNIKGKRIMLHSSNTHGNSHVKVEVQKIKNDQNDLPELIGPVVEGIGGFIHVKDFDYDVAERAALEVATAYLD